MTAIAIQPTEPSEPAAARLASVRVYQSADKAAWNAFVLGRPDGTFFHLAEWREVLLRAFRHAPHYLIAERDGEIHGVLPLAHVRSTLFGNALVSTPFCVYGGILAADPQSFAALEAAACSLARELGVDHLEMRNRERRHPSWPCKDLYVTFRREISPDPEKNLTAIPRKQRAMVRKGIQKGLAARVDQDVALHFRLYSESLRNLGTPVFDRKYLAILCEVFGSACEVLTVLHEGTAVASVLIFNFRDEVLPYYGGGSTLARPVAGNDFMYWQVMERARERGARIYDYGRSKRESGSYDFKIHWGFVPQQLYYEYFLVKAKALPNLSPTNPKYSRMIRIWQKLPLPVANFIGPFVARYLG